MPRDGPEGEVEEWVEIRIQAEPIHPRRGRALSFEVILRAEPKAWAALREMLRPGSGFLRTYRDIRIERRTVRTYRVESPWEPISPEEPPEA
jgi:hypothetical protein